MRLLQISVLSLWLLTSCNLLSLEKDEEPDPFQPVFTADIDGEPFEAFHSVRAGITKQGKYDWFQVFGTQFSETFFPYNEKISFALILKEGASHYDTSPVEVSIKNGVDRHTGGRYREKDGDAALSGYEALSEGDGYITVEMEQLEDGRTVVSGTFEMTVAKEYGSGRREADTLHITNGKYRVLLMKDERE